MTKFAKPFAPQPIPLFDTQNSRPVGAAHKGVPYGLSLLAILLLATLLRVYQLDQLPPGLHYDEAFNGVMARQVLRGIQRPIFFTENFGEEPLHIYTDAVLFALIGESPWTIRLTSAIFGIVFVAASYACVRALFPAHPATALAAAMIAATLYWSLNFSRIGIEPNGLAMMVTLSATALAWAYRTWKWRWVFGAGFLLGATVYTYLASRLWPLAVGLWFLYLVLFYRQGVRAHLRQWSAMGLVAVLTLLPLVLFFIANPVAFGGRSGVVFTPETFGTNLARTAAMFFIGGDMDPRDNLPGRPALDLILALCFIVGITLACVRARKPFYALLLIWLVVMCLPSALTEFAPNFRRAIGALPAVVILCALGLEWLARRTAAFVLRVTHWRAQMVNSITAVICFALLVVSARSSLQAYFVEWAQGTGLYYSFDEGLLELGRALAARPPEEHLYLSPEYDDHYTLRWALDERRFSSFDGRRALVLPNSEGAVSYGIITYEDKDSLNTLRQLFPAAQLSGHFRDRTGAPYATILTIPKQVGTSRQGVSTGQGVSLLEPSHRLAVRVDDFADLLGFDLATLRAAPGETLNLTLYWTSRAPAVDNYTVFVHLVGPTHPSTGSPIWAQADSQPARGTYTTREWQIGETILDRYALRIPFEAPRGEYGIQVGMYLLETGARVPLLDARGNRLTDDALQLTTITVE